MSEIILIGRKLLGDYKGTIGGDQPPIWLWLRRFLRHVHHTNSLDDHSRRLRSTEPAASGVLNEHGLRVAVRACMSALAVRPRTDQCFKNHGVEGNVAGRVGEGGNGTCRTTPRGAASCT